MSLTHKGFYQVVDAVYSFLIARDDVSTVTIGTVNDADLNKQTVFPLVHMVPTGASRGPQVTTYGFTFYFLDWVNETKGDQNFLFAFFGVYLGFTFHRGYCSGW